MLQYIKLYTLNKRKNSTLKKKIFREEVKDQTLAFKDQTLAKTYISKKINKLGEIWGNIQV